MRTAKERLELTPLAKIEADKEQLEQLVLEGSKQKGPETSTSYVSSFPFILVYLCLNLSTFAWAIFNFGPELALHYSYTLTLGILFLQPLEPFSNLSVFFITFAFFCLPHWLCFCYFLRSTDKLQKEGDNQAAFTAKLRDYSSYSFHLIQWLLFSGILFASVATAGAPLSTIISGLAAYSILLSLYLWIKFLREELDFSSEIIDISKGNPSLLSGKAISSKLELYRNLSESAEEYALREDAIADYAPDLLLALSADSKILACNKACFALLGFLPENIIGASLQELISSPEADQLLRKLKDIENQRNGELEVCWHTTHGKAVYIKLELEWSSRESLYFACGKNISAQKETELARSQYMAMLSHDVGTPLSSALLSLYSLKTGTLDGKPELARETILRVEHGIKSVIDLLGEIIDLERSSEGKLLIDKNEVDLGELVQEALELLSGYAQRAGVEMQFSTPGLVLINADRKRILRVLINLISNAIKHSNSSPVIIEIEQATRYVKVLIRDFGPGIAKHLQKAIFDRYFQIETANPGKSGHGLGLAVCQCFVQAHDGIMDLKSEPGQGSTFSFSLPRN